jgi:hypothetical protein
MTEASADSVFDEVPDEMWEKLNNVNVTSDLLRQLHTRAKPKTISKPVRALDTLSTMSEPPSSPQPSAPTQPLEPATKPARPTAKPTAKPPRPKTKATAAAQRKSDHKVSMKLVTGTMALPDRYSRVRVETEDGEELDY